MKSNGTTKITTPTDREIVITRAFNAPRALVWEAISQPDLIKRWLLGPPAWSMALCEEDSRVGGIRLAHLFQRWIMRETRSSLPLR